MDEPGEHGHADERRQALRLSPAWVATILPFMFAAAGYFLWLHTQVMEFVDLEARLESIRERFDEREDEQNARLRELEADVVSINAQIDVYRRERDRAAYRPVDEYPPSSR